MLGLFLHQHFVGLSLCSVFSLVERELRSGARWWFCEIRTCCKQICRSRYWWRTPSIRPNAPEFSERERMVWEFLENPKTVEVPTIYQCKIPEAKSNEMIISKKLFSKSGFISWGCPLLFLRIFGNFFQSGAVTRFVWGQCRFWATGTLLSYLVAGIHCSPVWKADWILQDLWTAR